MTAGILLTNQGAPLSLMRDALIVYRVTGEGMWMAQGHSC